MLLLAIEAGVLQNLLSRPTPPDTIQAKQYAAMLETQFMMHPEKATQTVALCTALWSGLFGKPLAAIPVQKPQTIIEPAVEKRATNNAENIRPTPTQKTFTETVNGIPFTMVYVEGGSFQMGDTFGDGHDWEKPVHKVRLDGYYIGETPVTQALWRAVMGSDPARLRFKGCDQCPVEGVSWEDIVNDFLPKLNRLTGKIYRLPTEAEWEYAARGGRQSKGYKYAGSDEKDEVAWHGGNSGGTTHPVRGKKANELGLYDMSGNVWEWCEDDWHGNYNGAPQDGRAWVDNPRGSFRVFRGRSWGNNPHGTRVANRSSYGGPAARGDYLGFRVAVSF